MHYRPENDLVKLPTGDERERKGSTKEITANESGRESVCVCVLMVILVVEGSKWAEAWQTAKRIKYRSTTKAVSQGRLSHKSPSSATHLFPHTPPRTSNLLLPRQRSATKTAPDMTKNKTADRCRYCHAECALPSSSSTQGGEKEQPAPPTPLKQKRRCSQLLDENQAALRSDPQSF